MDFIEKYAAYEDTYVDKQYKTAGLAKMIGKANNVGRRMDIKAPDAKLGNPLGKIDRLASTRFNKATDREYIARMAGKGDDAAAEHARHRHTQLRTAMEDLRSNYMPKEASLAAAAKIVKSVGSTLKGGAVNTAFSAVSAGANQAQPTSNNFTQPESGE